MPYRATQNGRPYGDPMGYASTLAWVRKRAARRGGQYRIKRPHEDWSGEMGSPRLFLSLARAMRKAAWGALIKVEVATNSDPVVYLIKKLAPPPPDPLRFYTGNVVNLAELNERVAKVGEYAKRKVPRVQCSGAVFTRPVDGTSTWSQHSRFPTGGNALDLTCYVGDDHTKGIDMDATQDVCDVLVAAARAGHLEVDQIIFKDQQYRYPGFAATSYGGRYHTHVHVSGRPYQSGSPIDA